MIKNREKYFFLFLLLLVAVFFQDVLFWGKSFWARDLIRYYIPNRFIAQEMVQQGIFPLWNPYQDCGLPLFAQVQNGILHPLTILYYLFPFYYSFKLIIVLQFIAGGSFLYLALRSIKLGAFAAAVGALAFVFCGPLLSLINNFAILQSVILLPLVYVFLDRSLLESKLRWYALLAAVLLLQMFSGQPEVLLNDLLIIIMVLVMNWLRMTGSGKKRFFKFSSVTLLFLVALAAVQYAPFIEYIFHSDRSQGLSSAQALSFQLHPWELVSTIIPEFVYIWRALGEGLLNGETGGTFIKNLNFGIIACGLLLCSIGQVRNKRYLSFLLLGLCSLLLSCGNFTPVYQVLLDYVPGFNVFRYPIKFMFLGIFCLAVMIAYGTEYFLKRDLGTKLQKRIFISSGVFFVSLIVFIALWLYGPYLEGIFQRQRLLSPVALPLHFAAWTATVFKAMRFSALLALILAIGLLALAWSYQHCVIRLRSVKYILLALLLINLWLPSINKEPTDRDQEVKNFKTPLIQYLKQDPELFRVYLAKSITETLENTLQSQLPSLLPLNKKLLYYNTGQISHIYYLDAYEAFRLTYSANLKTLLNTSPALSATPILTLLNAKYALSVTVLQDRNFMPVFRTDEAILYRNSKYLPRVSVIPQAVFVTDEKTLYRKFIDNFDPTAQILLEGTPPEFVSPGRGQVKLLRYGPTEIVLQTLIESEQAWVLLADTYFPGWYVYIDGIPAKIYKADYSLRGVLVPGGKHLVRFQYSPLSFRIGLFTSLIALFVLSLYCLRYLQAMRSN